MNRKITELIPLIKTEGKHVHYTSATVTLDVDGIPAAVTQHEKYGLLSRVRLSPEEWETIARHYITKEASQ